MVKRRLRLSPEFIEDLMSYSKDPNWGKEFKPNVHMCVDHEDGHETRVPVDVTYDVTDGCWTVHWEVSDLEDMFEREVFRDLKG